MSLAPGKWTEFLASWVVYLMVALGISQFTEESMWVVLGIVIAARTFFALIDAAASVLSWRVFGKRCATQGFLRLLRENGFPQRRYEDDDVTNYLCRVENDRSVTQSLQRTAKETVTFILDDRSMMLQEKWNKARMRSAADAALEIYSPRANTPGVIWAQVASA